MERTLEKFDVDDAHDDEPHEEDERSADACYEILVGEKQLPEEGRPKAQEKVDRRKAQGKEQRMEDDAGAQARPLALCTSRAETPVT